MFQSHRELPSDLPRHDCLGHGGTHCVILRADPVVRVYQEQLEELLDSPWARFHDKEFVTFNCCNRSVTYRIGGLDFMSLTYLLSWPD